MEIGGDTSPLGGRRGERPLVERLPLLSGAIESVCQAPGERHFGQQEQDQPGEQKRKERGPDPLLVCADRTHRLVRLEEERRAVGRTDSLVYLQQGSLSPLEAILGLRQVAYRRVARSRPQRRDVLLAKRVLLADQRRLVGVQDAALRGPELDTDDALVEDIAAHDAVERGNRRTVTADEVVG